MWKRNKMWKYNKTGEAIKAEKCNKIGEAIKAGGFNAKTDIGF